MTDFRIAQTTCADLDSARRLADQLLSAKLAACVSVSGPVESRYRWQGQLTGAEEHVLTIKTRADKVPALKAHLAAEHPYEVPELLLWPISDGAPAYLAWMNQSLDDTNDG